MSISIARETILLKSGMSQERQMRRHDANFPAGILRQGSIAALLAFVIMNQVEDYDS